MSIKAPLSLTERKQEFLEVLKAEKDPELVVKPRLIQLMEQVSTSSAEQTEFMRLLFQEKDKIAPLAEEFGLIGEHAEEIQHRVRNALYGIDNENVVQAEKLVKEFLEYEDPNSDEARSLKSKIIALGLNFKEINRVLINCSSETTFETLYLSAKRHTKVHGLKDIEYRFLSLFEALRDVGQLTNLKEMIKGFDDKFLQESVEGKGSPAAVALIEELEFISQDKRKFYDIILLAEQYILEHPEQSEGFINVLRSSRLEQNVKEPIEKELKKLLEALNVGIEFVTKKRKLDDEQQMLLDKAIQIHTHEKQ